MSEPRPFTSNDLERKVWSLVYHAMRDEGVSEGHAMARADSVRIEVERESALRGAGDTPAPPLDMTWNFIRWIESMMLEAGFSIAVDDPRTARLAASVQNAVELERVIFRGNTPAQKPLRGIALAVECDVIEFQAGMLARAIREDHPQVDLLTRELLERVAALSGVPVEPRPPEDDEEPERTPTDDLTDAQMRAAMLGIGPVPQPGSVVLLSKSDGDSITTPDGHTYPTRFGNDPTASVLREWLTEKRMVDAWNRAMEDEPDDGKDGLEGFLTRWRDALLSGVPVEPPATPEPPRE